MTSPGRFFELKAADLGSLDVGTPLYFRRLEVGQVASYALAEDGKSLNVRVFVRAPYDQYVTPNTRFWQASGIDMSLSASGLSVQTQSLLSILVGGIAFETPATGPVLAAAEADTEFTLFRDREEAFKLPARNPQTYVVVFKESVRGLDARRAGGVQGNTDRGGDGGARAVRREDVRVLRAGDHPGRSGEPRGQVHRRDARGECRRRPPTHHRRPGIARGPRAAAVGQPAHRGAVRGDRLLPRRAPASVDWSQEPAQLPTVPGQIEAIEANVVSIIKKIDQMPIKGIGDDLRKALAGFDQTLASARGTLGNADRHSTMPTSSSSPTRCWARSSATPSQEVNRAARGLRVLADYLERHPEALLRGKPGEAK